MIFLTVGSQKFPFDRLIKKVDQMIRERLIEEEVFIQTGTSTCLPCCGCQAFCQRDLFDRLLETCDILITHGGAGTMVNAAKRGKRIIAVPRLARYGEHVDDHQLELTERLHEMRILHACTDVELLPQALRAARNGCFEAFSSHTEAFLAALDGYLRQL